ncbi:MAG: hypothetical protein PUE71_06375 [Clostridia bacterium]|nr:hypothetical protein [Clostridia bacterium]
MRIADFGYNGLYDMNGRMSVRQSNNVDSNAAAVAQGNVKGTDAQEQAKDSVNMPKTDAEDDTGNELLRRRRPSESINNLVFDFKKDNDFNLVGASSKLEDLDVEKALSDMQKDSVLSQYRFFVKPSEGLGTDSDGTVRKVIRDFNEM